MKMLPPASAKLVASMRWTPVSFDQGKRGRCPAGLLAFGRPPLLPPSDGL